jgi:hypothetical protein
MSRAIPLDSLAQARNIAHIIKSKPPGAAVYQYGNHGQLNLKYPDSYYRVANYGFSHPKASQTEARFVHEL